MMMMTHPEDKDQDIAKTVLRQDSVLRLNITGIRSPRRVTTESHLHLCEMLNDLFVNNAYFCLLLHSFLCFVECFITTVCVQIVTTVNSAA